MEVMNFFFQQRWFFFNISYFNVIKLNNISEVLFKRPTRGGLIALAEYVTTYSLILVLLFWRDKRKRQCLKDTTTFNKHGWKLAEWVTLQRLLFGVIPYQSTLDFVFFVLEWATVKRIWYYIKTKSFQKTQGGYQVIIILPIKKMAAAKKQYFLSLHLPSFKVRGLQMTTNLTLV